MHALRFASPMDSFNKILFKMRLSNAFLAFCKVELILHARLGLNLMTTAEAECEQTPFGYFFCSNRSIAVHSEMLAVAVARHMVDKEPGSTSMVSGRKDAGRGKLRHRLSAATEHSMLRQSISLYIKTISSTMSLDFELQCVSVQRNHKSCIDIAVLYNINAQN